MIDLRIESTPSTPEIEFKNCGEMSIKGKSLPEDPRKFFMPLFDWINEMNANIVSLDVQLEYVNTSSSKNILELIKSIDNQQNVKHLNLKWHYELDDMDMLEFGEIIQRSLKRAKVEYLEYEDSDENYNF